MVNPNSTAVNTLNVLHLDLEPYARALELQHVLVAARRDGEIQDTLVLLRHPPVITVGRRGDEGNILVPREWLREQGVDVHRVERGGDVTYHGPEQLVGYPIIDLRRHRTDVSWYMNSLEEVLLRTLRDFGIAGQRLPGNIGVWLDERQKIVSLGVRIEGWITYHGFALNVGEDLSSFEMIVPCGLADAEMSSMERVLGREVDMSLLRERVVCHFCGVFGLTARVVELDRLLPPTNVPRRPVAPGTLC